MYLTPEGISYDIWISPDPGVQSVLLAFRILPSLSFLIGIPAITLILNQHLRQWWLNSASLIFISSIVIFHSAYLRSSGNDIIFPREIWWLHYTAVLWIPIVISTILYPAQRNTQERNSKSK